MKYIVRDRNSKDDIIEYSSNALNFLYNTLIGRIILKLFITKTFNNLLAKYMNSKYSKHRIGNFVIKNDINLLDYSKNNYRSYNDFFTRKIKDGKRPIMMNKEYFIAPCDARLSVHEVRDDLVLKIKHSCYDISSIVNGNILGDYKGGYALVFRLGTDNYHRYCYVDSGTKGDNTYINGVFHTVQPISLKRYNFYKTNSREYTILNTNNFNKIVQVEIGAMGIGRITNLHKEYSFKKGEEKGFFEFGGSTIVLFVKKDIIEIDEDILSNSLEGIETNVKYGEKIAIKK